MVINDSGAAGLSPRVRGKLCRAMMPAIAPRSIPACAGEAAAARAPQPGIEVYPRVCGGSPRRPRRVGVV